MQSFFINNAKECKIVMLINMILGYLTTDLMSGIHHWFSDSYRTDKPEWNNVLFDNFQIHHKQPNLIAKHDFAWVP
eukprot:UN16198